MQAGTWLSAMVLTTPAVTDHWPHHQPCCSLPPGFQEALEQCRLQPAVVMQKGPPLGSKADGALYAPIETSGHSGLVVVAEQMQAGPSSDWVY